MIIFTRNIKYQLQHFIQKKKEEFSTQQKQASFNCHIVLSYSFFTSLSFSFFSFNKADSNALYLNLSIMEYRMPIKYKFDSLDQVPISMAESALTKQQKEWNKQLNQHLERYLSLRDWSQLAAWLSKLKHHFSEKKGPVQDKVILQTLLKRLATSLNAALPVALHESTLQIYEMLFQLSIINGQELHIVCIGLFSFYSQSNVKNKSKMVQILAKYLPVFGKDLQVLATGLAITILPSLNEMHEALVRDVSNLFDLLSKNEYIGQQTLAEAVWVAILRSPSCRVAGLKYITNKLGRGAQQQQKDEQDNFWNQNSTIKKKQEDISQQSNKNQTDYKILMKEYCPRIETLVINALTICVEDTNILAVKAGLDFLYKYLPLRSQILQDKGKLRLTKCVVWLLGKRDTSVTRKINLWLFGKPDDQNRYNIQQKQLKFIIEALVCFLESDTPHEPIKIAFNMLSQHEELPKLILKQLSLYLLQFCKKQENNPQVLKTMHRLMERIPTQISIIFTSIFEDLYKALEKGVYEQAQKILNLSVFFLNTLLKAEQQKSLIRTFWNRVLQSSIRAKWNDHEYTRLALRQSLQILTKYKETFKGLVLDSSQRQLIEGHIELYSILVTKTKAKEHQGELFEEEIWLLSRLLVKSQQNFDVFNNKWVSILLQNLALNNPQHFISPIEVIGQSLERDSALKKQILIRSEEISKFNCIRVSLSKLWGILSLGHLQAKVIPLLLRLVKHFPGFFQKLLEYEFQVSGQLAIIKFRLFWQVSPKYPQIMGSDQVQESNKYGLFRMLQFLDSGNPLVKYHSNLWISQAFPAYHRVLNPILEIMLKPKDCWYRTPQGQFIYAVLPEVKRILQSLRYLKSLIRLVPQKFNKFAFKPLTAKILPYYRIFKGEDPGKEEHEEVTYIQPLIELVVRLTQSKFPDGDNRGVDLLACELLEVIVRSINTPELSNYLLKNHFRSLLRSLHFATVNDEHLLQIQLLALLQLILVQTSVKKLADGNILSQVVSHDSFSSTILEGVGCSFPYIKQRFVWFLNECIPIILQKHVSSTEIVSRIFNTYCNKIAYANSKKVQASSLKDLQISQKNAQILILFEGIKELLSQFLNLHLQPFDKEKTQHDTDSGLFSFYSYKAFIHLKIQKKPTAGKHKKNFEQQFIAELPQMLSIMAQCWTLSQLSVAYGLTRQGLPTFDYNSFLNYNRNLGIIQSKVQTQQTIQSFLVSLFRILLNTYRIETMRALVKCWANAVKVIQIKVKLLELLIFTGLPIEHFYNMLHDAMAPQKSNKKRRPGTLQLEHSAEQDVLQLCLAYSQYSFQHSGLFQTHNLLNLWLSFLKFLKLFQNTRSILTFFALVELIDLFIAKYNPKQIMREQRLKKEWAYLSLIFSELIAVCCGKLKIDIGGSKNIKYRDILPLPSSAFQAYIASKKDEQSLPLAYLSWEQIPAEKGIEYMRLIGMLIAKRVSYNFLLTLHNDSQITLVKKARQVITSILPLIQDKQQKDMTIQGASDLILCLLQKKPIFLKELKHEILHIFNKEDFFICSSKTLQNWAKIIDLLIDNNKDHDIFQQYLQKVSLASSLFSSYTFQTKKKIKSFERICFILYSGKKDKYTQKAQQLIDKIIQVTKNTEAPQPVLILIFFCIRILILRTSAQKLTKLLSTLWQNIIFLLTKTFNTSAVQNQLNQHWAALKLIQMISLMQIAQFHPHQWMFFYDFVGVKFTSQVVQNAREIHLGINPKIHQFLAGNIHIVKQQAVNMQEKRHLIIKQDKIDDIELLKTKSLLLSTYLVASNSNKLQFDMREVQELIDNDFLNLDEFIFKV